MTVYDDHLEGYVWHENIGWIRLGTFIAGGTHTYANGASAADYGVNNTAGVLSGYGWSTNVGWVNFKPKDGGVTIDSSGNFDGYAWGENVGWICFAGTASDSSTYKLQILVSIDVNAPALCADTDGDGKIRFGELFIILRELAM